MHRVILTSPIVWQLLFVGIYFQLQRLKNIFKYFDLKNRVQKPTNGESLVIVKKPWLLSYCILKYQKTIRGCIQNEEWNNYFKQKRKTGILSEHIRKQSMIKQYTKTPEWTIGILLKEVSIGHNAHLNA